MSRFPTTAVASGGQSFNGSSSNNGNGSGNNGGGGGIPPPDHINEVRALNFNPYHILIHNHLLLPLNLSLSLYFSSFVEDLLVCIRNKFLLKLTPMRMCIISFPPLSSSILFLLVFSPTLLSSSLLSSYLLFFSHFNLISSHPGLRSK